MRRQILQPTVAPTLCFAVACLCLSPALAQNALQARTPVAPIAPKTAAPTEEKPQGTTHALIICGHPGSAQHLEQYAQSVVKIRDGLIANYNVDAEQVSVLFGEGPDAFVKDEDSEEDATDSGKDEEESAGEQQTPAPPKWLMSAAAGSRENLEKQIESLTKIIRKKDSLWVITIGHAHLDKGRSWFNLPGPDMQQTQFAKLFENVAAERQLFFVTTPASGFYIKPLSRPGRIIISATEADREINETVFPHALAEVINQKPAELPDVDEDGSISVFDLYIATVQNVADRYYDTTTISTEHAQLDDNGDRRTSEVQRHYLDEERGGLPARKQRKTLRAGADGVLSRQVVFAKATAKPAEVKPADAAEVNPTANAQ